MSCEGPSAPAVPPSAPAVPPCCWLSCEEADGDPRSTDWTDGGELAPDVSVVVDTDGGSLNVAQVGFFLRNLLL